VKKINAKTVNEEKQGLRHVFLYIM